MLFYLLHRLIFLTSSTADFGAGQKTGESFVIRYLYSYFGAIINCYEKGTPSFDLRRIWFFYSTGAGKTDGKKEIELGPSFRIELFNS